VEELRGQRILITAHRFFGCWLLESFAWANHRLHLNAGAVALSRHRQTLKEKAPHLASDPPSPYTRPMFVGTIFPRMHSPRHPRRHRSQRRSEPRRPARDVDTVVTGTRRAAVCRIKLGSQVIVRQFRSGLWNAAAELTHVTELFPEARPS